MWLTLPGPYRGTTCWERELTLDHIHTFLTTQGQGGPLRMMDQFNAGTNSETTKTWKTHPSILTRLCGIKASRHLSHRWGKTPKKPHPGNLSRTGIEPGPAARQACMLPPASQRWTFFLAVGPNFFIFFDRWIYHEYIWSKVPINLKLNHPNL